MFYYKQNYIILVLILSLFLNSCNNASKNNFIEDNEMKETKELMTKRLRHVVLFKFKETSTEADIKTLESAFAQLPEKIKEIKDFEWGLNNSPEGLDKGFTHCFFVTFESEEARAVYLPHPDHQAFVALLGPHADDVLVFDYWAKE
jgi:hypothetical protein